jgi:TRAP-type C4-dicarboxylate transport system permease small subunit
MLPLIDRALTAVARLAAHAATVLALLVTGFVVLSAVMRYFIGAPLRFSDELVGLMVAALAFLALPHALAEGRHIRITAFATRLPGAGAAVARLVALVLLLAFLAVFTIEFADAVGYAIEVGSRTEVGGLRLYPWMLVAPACLALMAVLAVVRFLRGCAPPPRGSD